uniref:Tetraspanin n=1 Tax=Pygocentrus nattereri TaxID=42514 RepID=A0AAR2LXG4_PYGNA
MALDGCGQVCKFTLIIFNILFVLAGLAMLCGGLYLRFSNIGIDYVRVRLLISLYFFFLSVVSVLIVFGAVLLFAACAGDYGSCSENKSALGVLFSGKAPGVDEIHPEMLKALDIVGLSWLTRLCNIAWTSGTVPLDWQTGVVVPIFKKGGVCANYWGITLLSLPGKSMPRCWKGDSDR